MNAESLVSTGVIPLRTSDTGDEALEMMSEFYVRHLPIVNDKQLLGLISEDDILNFDVNEPVGSYSLSLIRPYVKANDHIYELMRLLADYQLTLIPVVDDEGNYVGVVTQEDVLIFFAKSGSFTEPGSIVVLDVLRRNYSLAEMARIVESENAQIISAFITTHNSDSSRIDVTIKVNRQNVQNILATFERFDYDIKASFNELEYLDSLRDRYDALMNYLNV